jgi:LysR family transcriptional regulator, glycine cleavage system transcriptional activator
LSLKQPSDLLKLPLLHLDDGTVWSEWLDAAGVIGPDVLHGPILNRASMLIDAAAMVRGLRSPAPHLLRGISSMGGL